MIKWRFRQRRAIDGSVRTKGDIRVAPAGHIGRQGDSGQANSLRNTPSVIAMKEVGAAKTNVKKNPTTAEYPPPPPPYLFVVPTSVFLFFVFRTVLRLGPSIVNKTIEVYVTVKP